MAPVAVLLLLSVALTLRAGPAMRYMETTARSLHDPAGYIQGVLAAPQRPDLPGGGR
jgi:multicomponent K+:H+ antiporter subunit D